VPDPLISDLPEHVIAAIGANPRRLGLSRTEYLRPSVGRRQCGRRHGTRQGPRPLLQDLRRPRRSRGHGQGLAVTWLVDKSALARIGTSRDAAAWAERIERGLVRIDTLTLLEVRYSARSGQEPR
jgi:hypothetical protein